MEKFGDEESLTTKIQNFSKFLSSSWPYIESTLKEPYPEDLKDDWLQANWEMLVERNLSPDVWLEVYGNGADCYPYSSRVSYKGKTATHRIICKAKKGNTLKDVLNDVKIDADRTELILENLVTTTDDGWYVEGPPFDRVLCFVDKKELILDLDKITFQLQKIESPD